MKVNMREAKSQLSRLGKTAWKREGHNLSGTELGTLSLDGHRGP